MKIKPLTINYSSKDKFLNELNTYKAILSEISEIDINCDDLKYQKNIEVDKLLENNKWKDILQGRTILKNFLNNYNQNVIKWNAFRNLLITEIKKIGIPDDIKSVIQIIRNSVI